MAASLVSSVLAALVVITSGSSTISELAIFCDRESASSVTDSDETVTTAGAVVTASAGAVVTALTGAAATAEAGVTTGEMATDADSCKASCMATGSRPRFSNLRICASISCNCCGVAIRPISCKATNSLNGSMWIDHEVNCSLKCCCTKGTSSWKTAGAKGAKTLYRAWLEHRKRTPRDSTSKATSKNALLSCICAERSRVEFATVNRDKRHNCRRVINVTAISSVKLIHTTCSYVCSTNRATHLPSLSVDSIFFFFF